MIETVQKEFKATFVDVVDKIQQVQLEMFANANKSVLELYFYIGETIENNIQWGNKFVDELSVELKIRFPKAKGYSPRNLTKKGNYSLNQTAMKAGVKNFGNFHNAGYKGLYNGETADDIAKRKKLRYREDILDNMGSDELIINLFRISQTDQKLKKDKVKGELNANKTHFKVGSKIRKTIQELGGTMPEDYKTPSKSIKEIKKNLIDN